MKEGMSLPIGAERRRYTGGAQWYHWITAFLMFVVIPTGWIFGAFKTEPKAPDTFVAPFPGSPADYAAGHMTIGLCLFVIVIGRLAYRANHPPPALSFRIGSFERVLAHSTHWLLYAVLIVMPVSGYIMSAGDKPPIRFLGLFDVPKLPITPHQGWIAAVIHVYTQFAVYGLIVLHLAGTAWHLFVRRDNALSRMLPEQQD